MSPAEAMWTDQKSTFAALLDHYVPHLMAVTGAPGLTLAIADRSGLRFERGYGYADLASQTPMTASTLMRVGSLSKLVTVAALLRLDERQQVGIYDPLDDVFGFRFRNPLGPRSITGYDLMTHSSGLATDMQYGFLKPFRGSLAAHLRQRVEHARRQEYKSAPVGLWAGRVGAGFRYSSLGMAFVGLLVEMTAGLPFGRHAADEIFAPLGMTSSYIPDLGQPDRTPRELCATGYMRFGDWCVPTPWLQQALPPSTGMITTAGDYARFLAMLLNQGCGPDGGRVLGAASVQRMFSPQGTGGRANGDGVQRPQGLGVEMYKTGGDEWLTGFGGMVPLGWWGDYRLYPSRGIAIVALYNQADMPGLATPPERRPSSIVCDLVADWLTTHPPDRPETGLSYQLGYAHGLVVSDRIAGLFGAGPLDPTAVDEMIAGGRRLPLHRASEWDGQGFADALAAMRGIDSPQAIRAFLNSPDCQLSPADLRLIALMAGARQAEFPVPVSFFADRVEPDPVADTGMVDLATSQAVPTGE